MLIESLTRMGPNFQGSFVGKFHLVIESKKLLMIFLAIKANGTAVLFFCSFSNGKLCIKIKKKKKNG